MKPPPVISDARVLEYASTANTEFTGELELYVGGVRLEAVAGLAICESFNGAEFLLFHCDEDWDAIGIQAWKKFEDPDINSVERVKRRAEKYYLGISSRWISHDASVEDAKAYRDYLVGDHRCSFCSRTAYEVDSLVEGNGVRICNSCAMRFHKAF